MGRLCADPELRQTQSGVACCRFRVAVNRQFANKQTGEREADFISCEAWRQTAEFVSKYFFKGQMIAVEGSLRNNDWTDQNGVKHYSMNVNVEAVYFCEKKQENNSGGYQTAVQPQQTVSAQTYQPQPQTPYTVPQAAPVQSQFPGYYEKWNDSPQAQQHTYANDVQNAQRPPVQLGDLSDFEEIITGETPF
jgi:single-strand DNA-binding protein